MRTIHVAASCLALVAGAPKLFATETREQTLQHLGGIQDEVDVFDFPGLLPEYKLALIELGTAGNTGVYGAAFAEGQNLAAGIAVSRSDWLMSKPLIGDQLSLFDRYMTAVTSSTDSGPLLPEPARPVEIMGAFRLGAHGPAFGLRLAAATFRKADTTDEGAKEAKVKLLAEQADVTLGVSAPLGRGGLDTGLTSHLLGRQIHSESSPGVHSETSVKSKPSVDLAARWLYDREGSGPYAEAQAVRRTFETTTNTTASNKSAKFTESVYAVEGGWAALFKQNDAKVFAGAVLASTASKGPTVTGQGGKAVPSYLTSDQTAQIKGTIVSGALSGEAHASGGFGGMVGLRYKLFGTITETDKTSGKLKKTETTVDETPDASFWSLGLSYAASPLRVDASYSKAFLHNGPYFVSGNATTPLFGRISASYAF